MAAISTIGRHTVVWVAALLVAVAVVAVGLTLLLAGGDDKPQDIKAGVPIEVSEDELRSFAGSTDQLVYWAGPLPQTKLELTRNARRDNFVRYLSGGAEKGDKRAEFTTVSTYPYERAFEKTTKAGKGPDMVSRAAPGGGLAIWSTKRPTSVYLAYPGSDDLVEVFDPDAARARDLVTGLDFPIVAAE